jgi:hypothetical protein
MQGGGEGRTEKGNKKIPPAAGLEENEEIYLKISLTY